jgi:hypothetical protein
MIKGRPMLSSAPAPYVMLCYLWSLPVKAIFFPICLTEKVRSLIVRDQGKTFITAIVSKGKPSGEISPPNLFYSRMLENREVV